MPGNSSKIHPDVNTPSVATAGQKMRAWQISAYGEPMQFSDNVTIPAVSNANDVLVKLTATSVNPIDAFMARGIGATTINLMRKWKSGAVEFPLILGRDFVGEVIERGTAVRSEIALGSKVWGPIPVFQAGSLAEYVVIDSTNITPVPKGVEDTVAVSVIYAGLTAWSALYLSGQLPAVASRSGTKEKRVCVLGASGGVGSLAVQMVRSEGQDIQIVVTCSADSKEMVTKAGANTVIDYRLANAEQLLAEAGPFDIVLDCAGKGPQYAREVGWSYSKYITLTSPLLENNDSYGVFFGGMWSMMKFASSNVRSLLSGKGQIKWGFVAMQLQGVEYLRKLLENQQLTPVIDSTFDFKEVDAAFRRLNEGHLRGKVVIKM